MDARLHGPNQLGTPLAQAGGVTIRRMRDDMRDYLLMSRWLTHERVLEYYEGRDNPHDLEKVREKHGPRARDEDRVVACIIMYLGNSIGYMQYYPLTDAEGPLYQVEAVNGVYGVDLFIGEPDHWDHGIGTSALSALVHNLFNKVGALRVVIDPQVWNQRAIRCYEKCGFKKIRVLPKHELHEGEYRDSWLMVIDRRADS